MTEKRTTPLRERMIEDMRLRGMGDKTQQAHIRAIEDFAKFLGHSRCWSPAEKLRIVEEILDVTAGPQSSPPAPRHGEVF